MGDCQYYGEPAGFMRKHHEECKDRHDGGMDAIIKMCVGAALHSPVLGWLPDKVRETAASARIDMPDSELRSVLVQGWCGALEASMEDHALSSGEKRGLDRYRVQFGLGEADLDAGGHFEMFRMMTLLNAIVEKRVLPRYDREQARAVFGRLPFNLMKSEELVWVMDGVGYMEQVTRREFRGSSMGVGFRVAKGVYVRPSTFRGRSVESSSMERTDTGMLGITTKHLYFRGSQKSFRVRLEKIVSFDPYADGVGIMRDTARAKPEVFRMGAGASWFTVNVIDALLDADEVALPRRDSPTLEDLLEADLDEQEEDDDGHLFAAGASTTL